MKYIYLFLVIAMLALYMLYPVREGQCRKAVEIWGVVRAEISQEIFPDTP